MPYDSGIRNPDGSITFTGPAGESMLSAPTAFGDSYLATLEARRQASAPLADSGAGGSSGGPPPDMSSGAGAQGGYRTKDYQMVAPAVADVGPSYADQGAQGAGAGVSPPPPPAPAVRPAEAAPAGPPGKILMAAPQVGGGPAGPSGPSYAGAAADMYAKAALAPSGGSQLVKGGTFQTGQETKSKMEGGKPDERIAAMSDQLLTQGLADQNLREAQGEHERYVDDHMGFARWEQEGLTKLHEERKQTALRGLQDERERVEKEVGETKIDPQEFWADKTDGDKIAFFLASAVTGYFNGRAGIRDNQVLDAVNARIKANVDAQIRNLETKRGRVGELGRIYQQAKEQWGDETIARNQAKIAALTEAEKTVRRQATETGSKVAMANADKMAADLAAQRERIWFDNAGKLTTEMDKKFAVTQDKRVGGGMSLEKRAQLLAKGGEQQAHEQRYASGGDTKKAIQQTVNFGGTDFVLPMANEAESAAARKQFAKIDDIHASVKELRKFQDSATERLLPSAAHKMAITNLTGDLSIAQGMGIIKEDDVKRMMDAATSLRSGPESLDVLERYAHGIGQSALRQSGAKPVAK